MKSSILIGNGINRSFDPGYTSLDKLLDTMNISNVKSVHNEQIPFTLKVVLGTGNDVHNCIKSLSNELWGLIVDEKMKALYNEILMLPVEDILTVNYGFELEEVACGITGERITATKMDRITDYVRGMGLTRKESNMFIHTYQKVHVNNAYKRIWHLHGHAKNPSSMLIGHYYYGNMLAKIRTYLQKAGNHYKWVEYNDSSPSINSWIDAFILNDVYVLGFGYDFAEMDLWWLLERKNRERASHGNLYFYEPFSEKNEMKHRVLDCYGAKVKTMGVSIGKNDKNMGQKYFDFYIKALEDIKSLIKGDVL